MTRIAASRLQPHLRGEKVPDLQQAQPIEADQRYLLSEFVYGDVADSEDRDPVDAIDAVIACRVLTQDIRIQITAAYQHDVAVLQDITVSQRPWEPEMGANVFSRART